MKGRSGCTCGSAWCAGTWAAVTTRHRNTPPPTIRADGHPLIRSLEPGEDWNWCYVDQVGMLITDIHGHTEIPPSPLLAG